MTVKDKEPKYTGPYKMAKLTPALSSNYYEYLIHDKSDNNFVQAWDLMMGVNNLASCIATLQKAIDKKNGIEEPEIDTKDLYHMQIDS